MTGHMRTYYGVTIERHSNEVIGKAFGRPARLHRYTFGGMVVAALWEAAS